MPSYAIHVKGYEIHGRERVGKPLAKLLGLFSKSLSYSINVYHSVSKSRHVEGCRKSHLDGGSDRHSPVLNWVSNEADSIPQYASRR